MVTPVKKVPIHLQSAANRLLIKGASIVNADGVTQEDVYVEDTKIKQVRREGCSFLGFFLSWMGLF